MLSNMEVFLNFLANNYALTKYITAYTKRYNICTTPFYIFVSSKANKNPKGLFRDILGSNNKFACLEAKWLDYVDNTIFYTPKEGDNVYCSYFDEDKCELCEWRATFKSGTKDSFVDTFGNKHNDQTFVMKEEDINN